MEPQKYDIFIIGNGDTVNEGFRRSDLKDVIALIDTKWMILDDNDLLKYV